jgi:uncharacterized OB-fold protein
MSGVKRIGTPTPDTQPYWDAARNHQLALPECLSCRRFYFYPRDHCPVCSGREVRWRAVSGRGFLYTYVIAHHPAPGFEADAPYVIAVVELEEGPRMMANIVGIEPDPALLELDMPLEVVFTERGPMTVPNFRPTGGPG